MEEGDGKDKSQAPLRSSALASPLLDCKEEAYTLPSPQERGVVLFQRQSCELLQFHTVPTLSVKAWVKS